jgi:hypothetical protein
MEEAEVTEEMEEMAGRSVVLWNQDPGWFDE